MLAVSAVEWCCVLCLLKSVRGSCSLWRFSCHSAGTARARQTTKTVTVTRWEMDTCSGGDDSSHLSLCFVLYCFVLYAYDGRGARGLPYLVGDTCVACQVLGHLGFDFENEEEAPCEEEVLGPDGKRSPTDKHSRHNSRGSSQFLSWGGTSAMSFEVRWACCCHIIVQQFCRVSVLVWLGLCYP